MPLEPEPTHVLAHISDTHLLAGGALLHEIDTEQNLRRALDRLISTGISVDAIVHTGDIADLGESDAYRLARTIIEPAAERLGAPVIWVAGNHDIRGPLRRELYGGGDSDEPLDSVTQVNGLRIIALDTSVPGRGHGDIDPRQLEWLREQLATPALHGTVLALHHPPVPTVVHELSMLQLRNPADLSDALVGTDVRAVLAGHFHYATSGAIGGAPVSVVTATSYSIRVETPDKGLTGVDGAQGIALLHLGAGYTSHTSLPLADSPEVVHLPFGFFETGPGAGTV